MVDSKRPYFVLILAVIGISFGAILAKLAEAPALIIAFYRNFFAALIILPYVLIFRNKELKRLKLKELLICLLSGFFLALHFASWIVSLKMTSVASSSVLVSTQPLFVVLISYLILKEKISRGLIPGFVMAFIGMIVVCWSDISLSSSYFKGDFLALLGALFMSVYLIIGGSLRKGISLWLYIFLVYGSCALILLFFNLCIGHPLFLYQKFTWMLFLGMALIPSIMGHGLINWSLKYLPASTVSMSILAEPVGATILAALILMEFPVSRQIAGCVLILLGLYYFLQKQYKYKRKDMEL